MATIDLGRIKFKWQGAWSSSTAYVVDDVVESGGNTYVCIAASTNNVPPNATYWELMAQKGTDTSVATTQGDIIYHNGTSLARLGAGTSGQFLKTQGTGANPVWADSSGGLLQFKQTLDTSNLTTTNTSFTDSGISISITPSSTSSKIFLMFNCLHFNNSGSPELTFYRSIGGGSYSNIDNVMSRMNADSNYDPNQTIFKLDSPSTTSAITYKVYHRVNTGGTSTISGSTATSVMIAQEIGV